MATMAGEKSGHFAHCTCSQTRVPNYTFFQSQQNRLHSAPSTTVSSCRILDFRKLVITSSLPVKSHHYDTSPSVPMQAAIESYGKNTHTPEFQCCNAALVLACLTSGKPVLCRGKQKINTQNVCIIFPCMHVCLYFTRRSPCNVDIIQKGGGGAI